MNIEELTARKKILEEEIYCPICGRIIQAANKNDVDNGIADCYVFVHDDIIHEDNDIEALSNSIN